MDNKRRQKRGGSEFLIWELLAIGVGVEGWGGGCMGGGKVMVKVEKEGAKCELRRKGDHKHKDICRGMAWKNKRRPNGRWRIFNLGAIGYRGLGGGGWVGAGWGWGL